MKSAPIGSRVLPSLKDGAKKHLEELDSLFLARGYGATVGSPSEITTAEPIVTDALAIRNRLRSRTMVLSQKVKKILIVNKYHFLSGGAERYFFNIKDALKRRGIEPIPFSVNYPQSLPSPYQRYFVEPSFKDESAKIQYQHPTVSQKIALFRQAVYNDRAARAVTELIEEERPEIAYFLNFNNHISPSAISACVKKGVPVVMRMSDFNLVCSSNMYSRNGHSCTDCKKGLHHAVIHRCVHGSFEKSLASVLALSFHRLWRIYDHVSAFVCPSQFMKRELEDLGIPPEKIHQINTFAIPQPKGIPDLKAPYLLYIGRLASYKGIDTAIRAFSLLNKKFPEVSFCVLGDENDDDAKRVRAVIAECGAVNVRLLPYERDKKRVSDWIRHALFMVAPSEFFENLPNTILESFSCGRPVIATRFGCMPDIVKEGDYGLLYELKNCCDLAEKMSFLISHPEERERMGAQAFEALRKDYSEEGHVSRLLDLFGSVIQETKAL